MPFLTIQRPLITKFLPFNVPEATALTQRQNSVFGDCTQPVPRSTIQSITKRDNRVVLTEFQHKVKTERRLLMQKHTEGY